MLDAEVNVLGTLNVLEAARAHGAQVVFSSTGGAIYGECERPAREDDPRRPVSPYGTAKLAAEEYLATLEPLYGTRHVVAPLRERLRAAAAAEARGRRRRDLHRPAPRGRGHARSSATASRRATSSTSATSSPRCSPPIGRDGGTFNVGTGAETSVQRALRRLPRGSPASTSEAEHAPARPGDALRSVLDVSRAERELGWRPRTPLERGPARDLARRR